MDAHTLFSRAVAFFDSFVKPGGRSSARLLSIGGGTCAAVYILADIALRWSTTVYVVWYCGKPWPVGVGMNENGLLTAFGTLITLGGGTYWAHRVYTAKRNKDAAAPGGDDAVS